MLATLIEIAQAVPGDLATAPQGIGKRAWTAELKRRLELRGFALVRTQTDSRGDDSDRPGRILLVHKPTEDTATPRFAFVAIERSQVSLKTRAKLTTARQERPYAQALVLVLYQPVAGQEPCLNCPEAHHVHALDLPQPKEWPKEVLTHSRHQRIVRWKAGGRGGLSRFPLSTDGVRSKAQSSDPMPTPASGAQPDNPSTTQAVQPSKPTPATGKRPALSGPHRAFAIGYFNCGDITRAYMQAFRSCNVPSKAKMRGRALLQRPEVAEFLDQLGRQGPDSLANSDIPLDGRKAAWHAEVERVAFLPEGKGKMPHRDKIAALKLLGEAHDWMPKGVTPQGVRATFIFNVPGMVVPSAGRVVGEFNDLPAMSGLPDESFERSEKDGRRAEGPDNASASDSASDKMSPWAGRGEQPSVSSALLPAGSRHSEQQAVDSAQAKPKTAVQDGPKDLFDASNS